MKIYNFLVCPKCQTKFFKNENILKCINSHCYKIIRDIPNFLLEANEVKILELEKKFNTEPKKYFSWVDKYWDRFNFEKLIPKEKNGLVLCLGGGSLKEKDKYKKLGYDSISLNVDLLEGVDIICDAHNLPFKSESFDLITSFEVLEHLKKPWKVIKNISEILKPGGYFVGSVAFLKPYHTSYFHMSHAALISLFEENNFNIISVKGEQNPYTTIIHNLFPLLPRWFGDFLTDCLFNTSFKIRDFIRKKIFNRKLNYDDEINKISNNLTDQEYEKLFYSGTIIIKAKKIR